MIYECLISVKTGEFVVARKAGYKWYAGELNTEDVEIVKVDVMPSTVDKDITLATKAGDMIVKLSAIDGGLLEVDLG